MAANSGNILGIPGQTSTGEVREVEILGSYARLTQKGLTLKTATGTTLAAGTVLKVSLTAKKYAGAAKADVATAVGILRKTVDISDSDVLANVVLGGVVKGATVKYTDDTDGLSGAELISLATALGGRYDATHDFLIF
jgi:hypothetical protein